jgi:formylglycine-generating enzyme required for sulfatase activity
LTLAFLKDMALKLQRKSSTAQFYIEPLSSGALGNAGVLSLGLEMVFIPGGSFEMGSPETEERRYEDESPQHRVTVPPFCMGKYPITQAQWRFVASLPVVNQDLDVNPSSFEGDSKPVENVPWSDASEFCERLSTHTGRPYRLPSEAEWEYACRAGTTTPFHFGNTIAPDVANYNWSETYGDSKVTKEKEQGTTPVGQFGLANAFGLYDMHGNVWEWCADRWHGNYENAPVDGSAWIDGTQSENTSYVLRGGSWIYDPGNCRSASRNCYDAGFRFNILGFRVVCSAPRT